MDSLHRYNLKCILRVTNQFEPVRLMDEFKALDIRDCTVEYHLKHGLGD